MYRMKKTELKKNSLLLIIICLQVFLSAQCSTNREKKNSPQTSQNEAQQQTKKENTPDSMGTIKVTFIELGSVNCIPCKMMQPVMKEVEEKYGNQVNVVFHDVWTEEGKPFGATFGIRAIPTQVFLDKDGKEYFRHEGFFPKEELVKVLQMKGVVAVE